MNLRDTYNQLFPPPIARRMVETKADSLHSDKERKINNACFYLIRFGSWFQTEEGQTFWLDILNLYWNNKTPTEEQIKEVFSNHNIPYK